MDEAGSPTILVVYDSRAIRETVSVVGLNEEWEVVVLDEPRRLQDCLETITPDAVLLCCMTDDTAAYDGARVAKKHAGAAFLPVLLYMLNPTTEAMARAFAVGADDVVKVTIKTEDLDLRIRSLLRIRRAVQSALARSRQLAPDEASTLRQELAEANRRLQAQQVEIERLRVQLRVDGPTPT